MTLSLKFILAISIADFVYSLTNIMTTFQVLHTTFTLCGIEAIIRQSSFILSIFFATCTAIASYKASIPQSKFNRKNFFTFSVIVGPIVCFLTSFSGPFFFREYVIFSFRPTNCTIAGIPNPDAKLNMFLVEVAYRAVPIILGITVTLYGYLKAIKTLKEISKQLGQEMDMSVYKLLWYPFVLMMIFLPSVIDPMIDIYTRERPIWVRAFRMMLPHSIGFANAILYTVMRGLYQDPQQNNVIYDDESQDHLLLKKSSDSIEYTLSNALADG